MKRIVSVAYAILMLFTVMAFAGCGSSAKSVDLGSVLSDINSNCASSTTGLTELTDVSDLDKYYSIKADDVKQFAAEITTDTSKAPVEIVMVEAKDADGAKAVKEALDARYQLIYSTYASYSAEQFDMVKKCAVTTKGNFVIMIVADGYDDIFSIVNKAIG